MRDRTRHRLSPVDVEHTHLGEQLRPLEHHHAGRRVGRERDCLVDERLVLHDVVGFDSARGRDDHFRGRVVDSCGQLVRREATEDHRMNGTESRAGKHCHHGLGHHRQVDDDPVAGAHSESMEHSGKPGHLVEELRVRHRALGPGDRAVVVNCRMVAPARRHVPVQCIDARVEHAVGVPPKERLLPRIQGDGRRTVPVDQGRGREPVLLGLKRSKRPGGLIGARATVSVLVHARSRPGSILTTPHPLDAGLTRRLAPTDRYPCAPRVI